MLFSWAYANRGVDNSSNVVKDTPLRVIFSTLFSVFGYPDETLSLVFDILLPTLWFAMVPELSIFRKWDIPARLHMSLECWQHMVNAPNISQSYFCVRTTYDSTSLNLSVVPSLTHPGFHLWLIYTLTQQIKQKRNSHSLFMVYYS